MRYMKKATVIVAFHDIQEDVPRVPGDVFSVKDERGTYLEKLGFVSLSQEEDKPKQTKKKAKKAE